jgi:hypothetical protein
LWAGLFAVRHHPAHLDQRGGEALGTYRFEEVVNGADAVGRHRVAFVCGDEHDHRRLAERRQQGRELETIQPRHRDVQEHGVEIAGLDDF